jgi:hypothetical protein
MERPPETCRVIFNKLKNYASIWFYYRNILEKTIVFLRFLFNPKLICHQEGVPSGETFLIYPFTALGNYAGAGG